MAIRDDQTMAGCDRKAVVDRHCVGVCQDSPGVVRVAEGAGELIDHFALHQDRIPVATIIDFNVFKV